MKNRDIFSKVSFFLSSLTESPVEALKAVGRGALKGHSERTVDKYAMPYFGLTGPLKAVFGAATLNPFWAGVGTMETIMALGHYHELGKNLPPSHEAGPPAPTPAG